MAYVIVKISGKERSRHDLDRPLVIGRAIECDIFLDHRSVSRRHCRIEPDGDGWAVVDLESRNGVYIHEDRISHHRLKHGETIKVGPARIQFSAVGSAHAEAERIALRAQDNNDTMPIPGMHPGSRPLPTPIPRMIPEDALINPPTEPGRRPLSEFPRPQPVPASEAQKPEPKLPEDDQVELSDVDSVRPSDYFPLQEPEK